MKYIINNRVYRITTKFDLSDELYESALTPDDGKPAEIKEFGYGETRGESVIELKIRLKEKGIRPEVDNVYMPWESLDPEIRRKIIVYMKGVKRELMGEWIEETERYETWREKVLSWTTKTYGYSTPFSYGEYVRL